MQSWCGRRRTHAAGCDPDTGLNLEVVSQAVEKAEAVWAHVNGKGFTGLEPAALGFGLRALNRWPTRGMCAKLIHKRQALKVVDRVVRHVLAARSPPPREQ
jgi:hypothetical protein